MQSLLQDVRFGVRTLLKNPGFSAVAILTLALAMLFALTRLDLGTYAAVAALLMPVTLLACYVPPRRAIWPIPRSEWKLEGTRQVSLAGADRSCRARK